MFKKPIGSQGKENKKMKTERKGKWQKSKNKVTDLSTNISVITLNANVLNTSIKDRDWQNRLKKYGNHIVPEKTHFKNNSIGVLNVKEWKKLHYVNISQKNAAVALSVSDKVDLRPKKITRDRVEHYRMIKSPSSKKTQQS